jgi:hypothetical protein
MARRDAGATLRVGGDRHEEHTTRSTPVGYLRAGCRFSLPVTRRRRPRPFNAPGVNCATLSSGSGSGNEVSRDFDVPNGCNRQELSYRGTQTAASGGFINFRVYDDTGFPAGSVGPIDLDEEQAGAALWTLDAGTTYSIEVTADGAEWSYTLKCR